MDSSYSYTPFFWPSIIAVLLLFALAVYSFRNRHVPGALPFSIACMFGLLWSLGSIFEYAAIDVDLKIFWRKFQVMFQVPSATAITCFLLEYTSPKRWLTWRNLILLSIVPILTILLIFTNDAHHLFWKSFDFDGVLVANLGPFAQYFLVYVYLLSFFNFSLLVWLFIRSSENRWPVAIMVFGQIMMRLLYFTDIAGRARNSFPYTAVGLASTSLIYAIVFLRFRILGPITLARQVVIEQIPIGMLVLDHQHKITSLNPMAERMLQTSSKNVKKREIQDLINDYPQESLSEKDVCQFTIKHLLDGKERDYLLDILRLKDWRNDQVGQLLLMTDVTEQHEAQAKILEQQRVLATMKERDQLARELHDDLAQVFAFIATQGQTIQRLLEQGDHGTADRHLARLIEAAREGEVDIRESIRAMRLTLSEHGLLSTLENYVLQFETNTSIHTDLVKSEGFDINLINPMVEVQLLRIIQEAMTNIRKHANASHVLIKFDVVDSSICVSVQDDGFGFELKEKDLTAANHFGLSMMRERAEAVGGNIRMQSQPGQGTDVIVCVPIHRKAVVG